MTVIAIRLNNFMAFEDTGWIELQPITLLFGRNSAGKSVITRALQLLKQSLGQKSEESYLAFSVEQGVDVGTFRTAIHGQDPSKVMTFHFRCDLLQALSEKQISSYSIIDIVRERINQLLEKKGDPLISAKDTPTVLDISVGFGWDSIGKDNIPSVVPVSFQIKCPINYWEPLKELRKNIVFFAERHIEDFGKKDKKQMKNEDQQSQWAWSSEWHLWSNFFFENETSEEENLWEAIDINMIHGFLPTLMTTSGKALSNGSVSDVEIVNNLLTRFREVIISFLKQIEYQDPIRPKPRRAYLLDKFEKRHWEQQGLSTFIRFLSDDMDREEADQLDHWMNKLGLGTSLKIMKFYTGDMGLMSIAQVGDSDESLKINLTDMGFGASQVLPIVVQAVLAKPGSLTIIEQPELHLHPRAQATLGDLFISAANRGACFLLETHSEDLFLRFRRRISETTGRVDKPDNFSFDITNFKVYFVNRENGISTIEEIKIDQWGDYETRPKGYGDFFGQDFEELVKMKKAHIS